jgi:NADPH:quinone reductase-like Zn-dependent oxidoreductase
VVMGTSTNPARRARLAEFGCDVAIDTTDPGWPAQVKQATGGNGVDLIIDQVSASVANQNLEAAKVLGRIVNVGRLGGMSGPFDFDMHAAKRIDYIGVTDRQGLPARRHRHRAGDDAGQPALRKARHRDVTSSGRASRCDPIAMRRRWTRQRDAVSVARDILAIDFPCRVIRNIALWRRFALE